jgi:hypothetical protein
MSAVAGAESTAERDIGEAGYGSKGEDVPTTIIVK